MLVLCRRGGSRGIYGEVSEASLKLPNREELIGLLDVRNGAWWIQIL